MLHPDLMRKLRMFDNVAEDAIEGVRRHGELVGRLSAGEKIFCLGEPVRAVFFALDMSSRQNTTPILVRVEYPQAAPAKPVRLPRILDHELFGETELLTDGLAPDVMLLRRPRRRETEATMLTPGHIIAVPLEALHQASERSPMLRQRLIRNGVRRLQAALLNHARRQLVPVEARLAEYLLELVSDYGRFVGNLGQLDRRIPQQDIADDLGISRRALSDHLATLQQNGLIRTTPLEILNVRRLRQLERVGQEQPSSLVASTTDDIDALLDTGELVAARALALDMLRHFPASVLLAHRAALAATRLHLGDDAAATLSAHGLALDAPDALIRRTLFGMLRPEAVPTETPLDDDQLQDIIATAEDDADGPATAEGQWRTARHLAGEIIALRASLAKQSALRTKRPELAAAAAQLYVDAHGCFGSGDHFAAVNAATLFAQAGDDAQAEIWAKRALAAATRATDHWATASAAEAQLLLHRRPTAIAKQPANGEIGANSARVALRRQLRQFPSVFGAEGKALAHSLGVPRPFAFTGTMLLAEQFSADAKEIEAALAREIRATLERENLGPAFGALAQGADIIIAEAVLARGQSLHVVLPFDIAAFLAHSVTLEGGGEGWRGRFDEIMRQCSSVTIAQPLTPSMRDLDAAFQHGFHAAAAMALERAAALETEAALLAALPKGAGGGAGGTMANVQNWARRLGPVIQVDVEATKQRASGASRHGRGFAPVIFHSSPLKGMDALDHARKALPNSGAPVFVPRPGRAGGTGVAIICTDLEQAVTLATRLAEQHDGHWQTLCDFGPVFDKTGKVDPIALAGLPGAAGLPSIFGAAAIGTEALAREWQFATGLAEAALPLGAMPPAGSSRHAMPSLGLFRLTLPTRKRTRTPAP